MSYTSRVLTAMNAGRIYSASDIAARTKISLDEVVRALNLLVKGGVIEMTQKDRFIKNRRYKSKQSQFAFMAS